jgi:hypothetical protein
MITKKAETQIVRFNCKMVFSLIVFNPFLTHI